MVVIWSVFKLLDNQNQDKEGIIHVREMNLIKETVKQNEVLQKYLEPLALGRQWKKLLNELLNSFQDWNRKNGVKESV